MGWGDEALARLRAIGPRTYEETLAEERARNTRTEELAPWSSLGAQVAGGIAPAVGAAAVTALTGGAAAPAAGAAAVRTGSLLARAAGRGAAVGAAGGAVQGAGEAVGNENIVPGAVVGAGVGAAAGGVLAPAFQLGGQAVRGALGRPEERAAGLAADTLQRQFGGDTLEQSIDAARAASRRDGGPAGLAPAPMTLGDVGGRNEAVTGMLDSLVASPITRAGTETRNLLTARVDEQGRRVLDAFQRTLSAPGERPDTLMATARQRAEDATLLADEAYTRARLIGQVSDARMTDFLNRLPAEVRRSMASKGNEIEDGVERLFDREGNLVTAPTFSQLIAMRDALRTRVNAQFDAKDTAAVPNRARLDQMTAMMDDLSEDFRIGRAASAGTKANEDAEQIGRLIGSGGFSPDQFADALAYLNRDLTASQREHIRIGIMQGVQFRVGRVKEGNSAVLGLTPNEQTLMQVALERALPTDNMGEATVRAAALERYLRDEDRVRLSTQRMTSGSQTASRQAATLSRRALETLPGGPGVSAAGIGGAGIMAIEPTIGMTVAGAAGMAGLARLFAQRRAEAVDGELLRMLGQPRAATVGQRVTGQTAGTQEEQFQRIQSLLAARDQRLLAAARPGVGTAMLGAGATGLLASGGGLLAP
jgi:hypothetical protein